MVNFVTGAVAIQNIEKNIVYAIDRGENMVIKFVLEKDETGSPSKSFHDILSRPGTKTMLDRRKRAKVKKTHDSICGEIIYLRHLAVNTAKRVPLDLALSLENSRILWSMFNAGWHIDKHQRVSLHEYTGRNAHRIRASKCLWHYVTIRVLPVPNMGGEDASYSMIAQTFLDYVIFLSSSVCGATLVQIHVVFDRYLEDSIKASTRKTESMV